MAAYSWKEKYSRLKFKQKATSGKKIVNRTTNTIFRIDGKGIHHVNLGSELPLYQFLFKSNNKFKFFEQMGD